MPQGIVEGISCTYVLGVFYKDSVLCMYPLLDKLRVQGVPRP